MTIRTRLIINFLLGSFIPMFFILTIVFVNVQDIVESQAQIKVNDLVSLKAEQIKTYYSNLLSEIEIAQSYFNIKTNLPIVVETVGNRHNPKYLQAKNMLDNQLKAISMVHPDIIDVELISPAGNIVYASSAEYSGLGLDKPFIDEAGKILMEARKGTYVSDIYGDHNNQGMFTTFVVAPVKDLKDKFVGFVVFRVDMKQLFTIVQNMTGLGMTGETVIGKKTDDHILFLCQVRSDKAVSPNKTVICGDMAGIPIRQATSGHDGLGISVDYRGVPVVAAWRYLPTLDWGIVTKIDVAEIMEPVAILQRTFIYFGIITLLFVTMAGVLIAKSLSEPIQELTEVANDIARGNLDNKIEIYTNDEVGSLARSIKTMSGKLKKLYGGLEEGVKQRTEELNKKNIELEKMNKFMVGRELKMTELKKEIEVLKTKNNANG